MNELKNKHTGSCLCKSITYSFSGEVNEYGFCHCTSCRKASGSAFSANAGVRAETFVLTDVKGFIKEYESSKGTYRFFCSNCGSLLFSKIDSNPDYIRVRLGSLDTSVTKKFGRHTFVSAKADWFDIADEVEQHEGKMSS